MKAKDWVARFLAKPDEWQTIIKEYVEETHLLCLKRGNTPIAIEGAFREQFQKWDAICKKVEGLHYRLLEDVFENMPETLWKEYCEASRRSYLQRRSRVISAYTRQQIQKAKQEKDPQVRLGLLIVAILDSQLQREELKEMVG